MRTQLFLHFSASPRVELARTQFKLAGSAICYSAVRGKTAGAFGNHGTFQWSRAVKALCIVLIKASVIDRYPHLRNQPHLQGSLGSLAASLSFAIDKQPRWLSEIFGANSRGELNIKRILLRSNSALRAGSQVSISVNTNLLSSNEIHISLEGQTLSCNDRIELIKNLINEGENDSTNVLTNSSATNEVNAARFAS